ncbi:amidohydrolase [Salicibibacter cibarius]|uniref:Amidohydrolase n=1 Tax=Salicibibacter cibarius TaxID=2743000 RepID=A0A7T7CC20_9BACI|nr:amidohydrolase family protein [Salicibibacter cibarius]QQK76488.1 amidohydrolase [Salicibibacter cibarius]
MFRTKSGHELFIIDAHIHNWNASRKNQRNDYGKQFIDCFYDYQRNLSPPEYVWDYNEFLKPDHNRLIDDVFNRGYADMAIFQPVPLTDFYREPFGSVENDMELSQRYPGRFICNSSFDPRNKEEGLKYLEEEAERFQLQGIKLYTAEWRGDSKGYKLTDYWTKKYLEKCEELGIRNIHIHKGPTITPLNKDAFDVSDVDDVASTFQNLNIIVEHVGLPRLEDFCWIATQEKNVYGGLAVAMPFVYARPRYFAQIISELLFWLDEDKIIFSSDYPIWEPGWLIEKFIDFELPEDIREETGAVLDINVKRKILGENIARLYNIDIPKQKEILKSSPTDEVRGRSIV